MRSLDSQKNLGLHLGVLRATSHKVEPKHSSCPDCGNKLFFLEAAFLCPVCGYSIETVYS